MRARAQKESLRGHSCGARLGEVRWVGQGLMVLTLVGCSRDNPWFVVDSAGAGESDGPSAGTSNVGSTADVGSSSSGLGDSGQVDMTTSTSTSTSSSTTDPGDSTTTTTDPGTTSSSDTGASTDSSTGEPEQEALLYDLHFECKNAAWADGAAQPFPCVEAALEPPSVTPSMAFFENKEFKAITVVPLQKPTSLLEGEYLVTLIGATNPHFRATLWFPQVANDTDQITGQIYLEIPLTQQVPFMSGEFTLKPGMSTAIDLDLTAVQNKAVDLEVHMTLTVDDAAIGKSRGVWLNPRIVHFP